mgnify:CR=1 FL=1
MEELITRTNTTPVKTFKDPRLNAAAEKLVKLYNKTETNFSKARDAAAAAVESFNREAAVILGKIAAEESYKADGFKDVKDFAVNGLNFDPRKVYTLVSAGKVYNAEGIPETIKALSPDNYEAVKAVGLEHLKKAAAEGVDFSAMTQKELKEYAAAHKADKPHKPKVMPLFDVTLYGSDKPRHGRAQADVETEIREAINPDAPDSVECVKLPSIKEQIPLVSGTLPQEREVRRYLYIGNGIARVYEFRPAVKEKSEKAKKADKDRADMIQRMRDNGLSEEQIKAIIG